MDFETYSTAGYRFDTDAQRWKSTAPNSPGIAAVGGVAYSEHPSTEVLSLAYDLKDGKGPRLWIPGMPPPQDLFDHIAANRVIEAHNAAFEFYIWENVCHKCMGWPPLPFWLLRDSMAKAKAWSLPGALGKLPGILGTDVRKDKEGKRLIRKFSIPRSPTKLDKRLRIDPYSDPEGTLLYNYCMDDIKAEAAVSAAMPDLIPDELETYLLTNAINIRGVYIDMEALQNCKAIVAEATERYTAELQQITGGYVNTAGELAKMGEWLHGQGLTMPSMMADDIREALKRDDLPPQCKRVLEIRATLGAASVKKLGSIERRICRDGRIRELFQFCGADRTGRFAGRGPQPQNLPNSGPLDPWGIEEVEKALAAIATRQVDLIEVVYGDAIGTVSGCLRGLFAAAPGYDFLCSDYSAIEAVVLAFMAGEQWRMDVFNGHGKIYEMSAAKITGISFEEMVRYKQETGDHHPMRKKIGKVAELACFGGDTKVLTDSGWKRITKITLGDKLWDGVEFVNHDGVVLKQENKLVTNMLGIWVTYQHKFYTDLAGWVTSQEILDNPNYREVALYTGRTKCPENEQDKIPYKIPTGWDRAGDVYDIINCGPRSRFTVLSEAGPLIAHNSGYQGSVGAWKAFGADKFMKSDAEIKSNVDKWRADSPNIVKFWYGLQDAAIKAVRYPGNPQSFRSITYQVLGDALYCTLPSGRRLTYHQPRITREQAPWGMTNKLSYMGSELGNWVRLPTYGGKLCENIVQAVARDILVYAMKNLERAGYPIVLHIHDEVVCEVLEGTGSIEELELIMGTLPAWCSDWPIKAAGGWRGKRYRKD